MDTGSCTQSSLWPHVDEDQRHQWVCTAWTRRLQGKQLPIQASRWTHRTFATRLCTSLAPPGQLPALPRTEAMRQETESPPACALSDAQCLPCQRECLARRANCTRISDMVWKGPLVTASWCISQGNASLRCMRITAFTLQAAFRPKARYHFG